jgi:hypothetical protein
LHLSVHKLVPEIVARYDNVSGVHSPTLRSRLKRSRFPSACASHQPGAQRGFRPMAVKKTDGAEIAGREPSVACR